MEFTRDGRMVVAPSGTYPGMRVHLQYQHLFPPPPSVKFPFRGRGLEWKPTPENTLILANGARLDAILFCGILVGRKKC